MSDSTRPPESTPVPPAATTRWRATLDSLALLLALLAGVAIVVLFIQNTKHYYFLGDDCFISFRYARHLAEGHGLVWNIGEAPVEGYTNLLWVLLLACGMKLELAPERLSVVLGLICAAVVLLTLLLASIRRFGYRDPGTWLLLLILACSRSFTGWSTGGLETQLFALLLLAACLRFAHERDSPGSPVAVSAILFAAAFYTRPDALLALTVAGAIFLVDVLTRRRSARDLAVWALTAAAPVGALFLWRQWYFDAWVPNTFHAKVPGFWWEQGWAYLRLFHVDYKVGWYAWLALLPALFRRDSVSLVFTTVLAAHVTYVASVGGGRFEFRFLVFVFPLFYWLLVDGTRVGAKELTRLPVPQALARAVGVAAAVAVLLVTWQSPKPQEDHRAQVASLHQMRAKGKERMRQGRMLRQLVDEGLVPADVRISVLGAGALPYYSRLYTIDYHGLTDRQIARAEVTQWTVGHLRFGTPDYLRDRGVAMFAFARNLVFPTHLLAKRAHRLRRQSMEDADAGMGLFRAVCRQVDHRYLLYATPLDEREDERILGHLPRCELRGGPKHSNAE